METFPISQSLGSVPTDFQGLSITHHPESLLWGALSDLSASNGVNDMCANYCYGPDYLRPTNGFIISLSEFLIKSITLLWSKCLLGGGLGVGIVNGL